MGALERLDPAGLLGALRATALAAAARPIPVASAAVDIAAGNALAVLAAAARALGSAAEGPARRTPSRRYADPAWDANPFLFLLRQQHAVLAEGLTGLLAGLDLPAPTRAKAELLANQLVAATEPANWPLTNPAVLRRMIATGGRNLRAGLGNALRDLATNRGAPRQVARERFGVGSDLAATPGAVVYRNRLVELIQYAPRTERVRATPMLFSPPWINRYYLLDLAPGRSLVQHAVEHGHTVFMISYRNPDADLGDLTLDDYLREGPLAALDVVRDRTGAEQVDVVALCLGGALAAATAAWCAAGGERRVHSLTLLNTLLDYAEPGMLGAFTDEESVTRLERIMARTGYLPAGYLTAAFDALRPADLFWDPLVTGWLLGEEPAPLDLLAWNADAVRVPAAMHSDVLRGLYVENRLVAGTMALAGRRLDLAAVRVPAYVVGAREDHIAPWTSVYAGARRLGGPVRFVLSNAGHVAGVVNPPDPPSPKSSYRVADRLAADPEAWISGATERRGSWWADWTTWVGRQAGDLRDRPPLDPVLCDAPGTYVLQG